MPRPGNNLVPSCRPIQNNVVMVYMLKLVLRSAEGQNQSKEHRAKSGTDGQSRHGAAYKRQTMAYNCILC